MKKTLTRLFTVALLMMVSLGARAEVKVLFGEKGTELQPDKDGTITLGQKELTGGTIIISQEEQKDGTTKVTFAVTPDKNYKLAENGLEVYAVIPPGISSTRGLEVSTTLTLKSEDFKDEASKRTYTATIDSKLNLWVKSADFRKNEDASKNTRGGLPTISTSSNPVYYLLQNSGTTSFYAMPYNNAENGKVTTTNVPNDDMLFYFMDAGEDGGIQYYYIIHHSGRYLYANGNANTNDGAILKTPGSTSPTEDRYKFYIELCNNSAVGEGYYIINKTLGKTAPLCKRSGNTPITNGTFLKLNTYTPQDAYFLWNFVKTPLTWTVPFTLSDGDKKHYYRINNTVNRDFYISRNASTGKVNTSSTASEDMYWYFEEVPAGDNGSDDYITYYYIIHALTGKYMCFDGNPLNYSQKQDDAVSIQEKTASNEENCQFIIPRSSQRIVTTYFNIIPKALKNYVWNNQTIGQKNTTNETNVYTSTDRDGDTNASRWEFFEVFQAETPVIQYDAAQNAIIITSATEGATIYYTTAADEASLADPTPSTGIACNSGDLLQDGVSNKYIKAIAVKEGYFASEASDVFSPVMLQCAKPVITRTGDNVTISCSFPSSGVRIYFTKNGGEPTASSTFYSGSIPVTANDVIKAIAIAEDYEDSEVAERTIRDPLTPTDGVYYINSDAEFESFVDMANADGAGFHYALKANISASTSITEPFTGVFDGGFYTISDINHALFNNINGGTVKNVILDGVSISDGTNVGTICNEASGATKIYNCGVLSGVVRGSGFVGGLVGHIESGSNVRVVNCYNYADVSSSGDYAAGIVGKNEGTVGNVRIALCMMYGSVSGATNISPVYAGNHTSNAKNFTEYNFYLYSNEKDASGNRIVKIPYTAYNDQLAIDKEEYLTRFPFYRHILNTHRELAAYFLFANNTTEGNVSDITEAQVNEIGHWAVKKEDNAHKYPIIELWEKNRKSTPTQENNNLPNTTADYAGKLLKTMGNSGYLSVSIKIGSNSYSASLPITDMDTLRYDYNYGKVILPFANEYEINTDYSQICTGWKITKVGSSMSSSVANYNFADRDNLQKDIYDEATNPFIYAQGGYYIVPTGVTGIEITANFATAYYLSDATYEIGYDSSYGNRTGKGGNVPAFKGQPLYNTLTDAVAALTITTDNPHKQAIVLVGNYHYDLATTTLGSYTGKGFTLMSIDADNNQEPDYGFYSIGPERPQMPPMRFDFLPIISLGMAAKVNGSNYYPGVPLWKSRGWYEQTETTVSFMNQFELDSGNFNISETADANKGKGQNPCIINGGYFVQMIRSNKTNCSKVSYFKIGGNAYIKEFYPGAHSSAGNITTTIVPINVTGGQVDECFMTGYRSGGKAIGSDIRFWCSGGKIGKFLGAYMDKPLEKSNSTNDNPGNVNMTAKVDHALIGRFFGGGTSQNAAITGNINVTINNSKVDYYCGGPEFGDMVNEKTVVTTANNTKFGEYYGAGFGGTSITYSPKDSNPNIGANVSFPGYTFNSTTAGRLTSSGSLGLATCYKFEYLMHSFDKNKLVARFITGYANFSLATTGNVTNNLTGCTVEKDFYGAGCQGKVDGTVTSTLTNCTIKRSAFGGGYKAVSNEVKVYPAAAPTLSTYNGETGIFSEFGTTTPDIFTWEQGTGDNPSADEANTKLKTSKNVTMAELGNVTGIISLTIDGGYVGGTDQGATPEVLATATTAAIPAGGNVYGGGNESKSLNNTTVTLKGDAHIYGNVYGGGNKAPVSGSATVNIE